ncbi:Protein NEF1, putative [Perkinsus marinus ATCC 50983]|uniref:Dolichyl-diphosphooligosaccharide-protein glycosyltransferase subunit OST5 n=1 Tax=Perkinsus marinus (strain ATCC 50983 / TXsc) TaxID=423536 RepID=C5LDX3_PERM5|nr:Protein NEF1, putative [Perkinsus marinus ATCC 50983]EER05137.1 Protein NEF1, putative [Perkinsus marinus ATCC 50983]|eukprot:XP_002773321.1 Protein NEF1, putative [Perkinsus marinus ATCC 50983]
MDIIPVQHLVQESMPTDTVPYEPPVDPEQFVRLAVSLLTLGLGFTCWLMMYNVTRTKFERSLAKELIVAAFASITLGTGAFFAMLSADLYV